MPPAAATRDDARGRDCVRTPTSITRLPGIVWRAGGGGGGCARAASARGLVPSARGLVPSSRGVGRRAGGAGDGVIRGAGAGRFAVRGAGAGAARFAAGGAAICVLAQRRDARLSIVDLGAVAPPANYAGVIDARIAAGTADFTESPAMQVGELEQALQAGRERVSSSAQLFIGGEMGIGNTTAAAAILAGLTGAAPAEVVGRGTGIDSGGLARKQAVVAAGLDRHRPSWDGLDGPAKALAVLRCVGGFEIAGLTGAFVAAAQAGVPVLVDGFIAKFPNSFHRGAASEIRIQAIIEGSDKNRAVAEITQWIQGEKKAKRLSTSRELHYRSIRATLFRDSLNDCEKALPDYEYLSRSGSKKSRAKALAWEGICASGLGQTEKARQAFGKVDLKLLPIQLRVEVEERVAALKGNP